MGCVGLFIQGVLSELTIKQQEGELLHLEEIKGTEEQSLINTLL